MFCSCSWNVVSVSADSSSSIFLLGFPARFDIVAIPEAYKYNYSLALRYLWLLICYSSKIFWFFLKNSLEIRRHRRRHSSVAAHPKFVLAVSLRAFFRVLNLSLPLFISTLLYHLLYWLTVVRVEDSIRPGPNSGHPTTPRPPIDMLDFFFCCYRVEFCANLCKKCNLPHKIYTYL